MSDEDSVVMATLYARRDLMANKFERLCKEHYLKDKPGVNEWGISDAAKELRHLDDNIRYLHHHLKLGPLPPALAAEQSEDAPRVSNPQPACEEKKKTELETAIEVFKEELRQYERRLHVLLADVPKFRLLEICHGNEHDEKTRKVESAYLDVCRCKYILNHLTAQLDHEDQPPSREETTLR